MKKKRLIDNLFAEVILYGGLPMQRADVYQDVLERTGSHHAADMFAFGLQAKEVDAEPITRAQLATILNGF